MHLLQGSVIALFFRARKYKWEFEAAATTAHHVGKT